MHEHETPEPAERRKPRAEAGGGVGGAGLLSLQRQAGNRAVAGVVARAVQIDEMTSSYNLRDQARLGKGLKSEIAEEVHGIAGAGGGAGTEEQESTGGGAETLPPGGHATMEQEPS